MITADYHNPRYVETVAKGLRLHGRFDAVRHWVDQNDCLWFEDVAGARIAFSPIGNLPRTYPGPPAYVPGDELIDE